MPGSFLFALALILCCIPRSGAAPIDDPVSSVAGAAGAPVDVEWGPESGGLSVNISVPPRLIIGEKLEVDVRCTGKQECLPVGHDLVSVWDLQRSMTLELWPVGSIDPKPVVLYQWNSGMPDFRDPGQSAMEAAGEQPLGRLSFLSGPSDHLLTPGMYVCILKAETPNHASGEQNGPYRRPASDRAKRCWFGEVASNGATVELVRAEPERVTVLIPRVLRVTKGSTSFTEADADKMTLEIPYGHVMGTSTAEVTFQTDANGVRTEHVGWRRLEAKFLGSETFSIGARLPIGSEIRLVVFSTNQPVGHMWMPNAGSAYRKLIERRIPLIGEHDPEPPKP